MATQVGMHEAAHAVAAWAVGAQVHEVTARSYDGHCAFDPSATPFQTAAIALAGGAMDEELNPGGRWGVSKQDREIAIRHIYKHVHQGKPFKQPSSVGKYHFDNAWAAARRLVSDPGFQDKCLALAMRLENSGGVMSGEEVTAFLNGVELVPQPKTVWRRQPQGLGGALPFGRECLAIFPGRELA